MLVDILWYITAILAVWGASLGGIASPAVGLLYPFRIVSVLLAVILLFKSRKADWNIGKKTWYTVAPFLVYITLFSVVSLLWVEDRAKAARVILNLLYVALFIVLFLRNVKDRKSFDNLLIALTVNFAAILLIGVYETFSGHYLFTDPAGVDMSYRTNAYNVFYPVVCFTNPNDYAFTIALTTPFMLYVLDEALKLKKWPRVVLKLLVLALSFFNMMNTCSRLGYLVYFIVLGIYFGLQIKKSKVEAVFLAALACFLVLSLTSAVKVEFIPVKSAGGDGAGGSAAQPITKIDTQDTSTKIRLQLIEKGLRVTRDTWGLGAGAKNSPAYMARYTDFPKSENYGVTDYHFFYLEVLADYGAIPLLLLLLFQAGAFVASIHVLRKDPEHRWLALCVLPGAVGFAFATMNCSSSLFVYIMWVQFAVWSLLTQMYWGRFPRRSRKD